MRTSKIAALAAATALLTVGSAIAAFAAANGWVEESGTWKYYKNGEAQTETFAKSGDSWYWLDENGEMVSDQLVEYNDNYYYIDENGTMVKNAWKSLPNTDDDDFGDHVWYYFQNTGKAYKSSALTWKTINGKKYAFNDDGKMLYGWIGSDGSMVSDDDNNAYQNGVYYCGDMDDGARRTSTWEKYYCVDMSNDIDGDYWFYFGSNGAKTTTTTSKTINGKKYAFTEDGIMSYEWVITSTDSSATGSSAGYAWFQDAETGAKLVSGWFKTVPDATMNATDYNNEDTHWYYADGKGNLAKSTIKSIKSKQYAFNEAGELVTGLQWVTYDPSDGTYSFQEIDSGSDGTILIDDVIDPANTTYAAAGVNKSGLHYFSADADSDGSMKTGSVSASANGDEYTFKLGTKGTGKGVGTTGKDGSYYYQNGYKLVADSELKVGLLEHGMTSGTETVAQQEVISVGTGILGVTTYSAELDKYWVITSSGSIVKSGTKTDSDGYKIRVSGNVIQAVYNTAYDTTDDNYVIYSRQ